MKSLYQIALCLALWGLVATTGYAQPHPNDNELQLTGSFFRPIGTGEGALNADILYSRHLADPSWEFGLRQSIVYVYNEDREDTWNAVTAPFVNYNFINSTHRPELVPFLGALGGAVYNDDDITGTIGPQAGAKWYVTESTFLIASYRYEWFFDDLKNSGNTQEANNIVAVGIGFNWGGGRH